MKILILNGYSDSNKGDLAITDATVSLLKSKNPGAEIILHSVFSKSDSDFNEHNRFIAKTGIKVRQMIVPSPYIKETTSKLDHIYALTRLISSYALLAIYMLGLKKTVKKISLHHYESLNDFFTADKVVMKGGQYIYNDQRGIRGILYLLRMLTPLALRNDIVLLSHSIGPIQGKIGTLISKKLLAKAKTIYAREDVTFNFLTKTLKLHNVRHIQDMAFYYHKTKPTEATSNKIGVTVVNWNFPEAENREQSRKAYVAALVSTITQLINKQGFEVELVPQVTVRHHGASDVDLMHEISAQVQSSSLKIVDSDLSPQALVDLYSGYKMVIGTRLHSCILALCANTPVLAIKYQGYKTEGVMAAAHLSEYVLDIYTVKDYEIIEKINHIISNLNELKLHINNKVTDINKQLHMAV